MSRLHRARCDPTRCPERGVGKRRRISRTPVVALRPRHDNGCPSVRLAGQCGRVDFKATPPVGLHEALVPGVCSAAATHRVRRRVACA